MEKRPNGSVNFRQVARDLGISVMTVYRVVNGAVNVHPETRYKVVNELNRRGCFVHSPQRQIKLLFDFTGHQYLTYYGRQLMKRLASLGYTCLASDHRKNYEAFLNMVSECDTVVFASIPDDKIITAARNANKSIYTITLSTSSNADVTLSPNNIKGAELAADHLHVNGHSHIAVHCAERHPTRQERLKAFFAQMKFLDPECQIDLIHEKKGETTAGVLQKYFQTVTLPPTALFFLAGEFAMLYHKEFEPLFPELCRNLSILTFDRPDDWEFNVLNYDFDHIEFFSNDLLDWAEYYITNRPMMKKRTPIHTSTDVRLVICGSVKNLHRKGKKHVQK